MHARIITPFLHDRTHYKPGELVTNPDLADTFVRLGVARPTTPDTEPVPMAEADDAPPEAKADADDDKPSEAKPPQPRRTSASNKEK